VFPLPHPAARARRAPGRPSAAALLEHGEQLIRDRDTEGACSLGERARSADPRLAAAHRFLGKCYLRLGRVEEARRSYRRYLDLNPRAEDAPFIEGILKP
jgi:Flp pilus assembly protein TadD